jgi:hypothetical protein
MLLTAPLAKKSPLTKCPRADIESEPEPLQPVSPNLISSKELLPLALPFNLNNHLDNIHGPNNPHIQTRPWCVYHLSLTHLATDVVGGVCL